MIISAYILPHLPILIPHIAKKNIDFVKKTNQAIEELKKKLIKDRPETIIFISPHKKNNPGFSINNHFNFQINFEDFGDYYSKIKVPGSPALAYQIKELLENEELINLEAEEKADYGFNIPAYLLLSKDNQIDKSLKARTLIFNTSRQEDLNYYLNLGKKIAPFLETHSKRISIIISAQLSHCHHHNAPGGFYQKAKLFDDKTIENLKKGSAGIEGLLKLDKNLVSEAKECGLRPIILGLGLISSFDFQAETLSYQKDLGVGCLVMDLLNS